jgi:hypothetical protein
MSLPFHPLQPERAHGTAAGASHSAGRALAKIRAQLQPKAVNRRKNS